MTTPRRPRALLVHLPVFASPTLLRRQVGDGVEARKGKRVGMYYRGWLESNKKQFDVRIHLFCFS